MNSEACQHNKKGKCKVLDWPNKSPDRNPTEHGFQLQKMRLKEEIFLQTAAESITKQECNSLVMSVNCQHLSKQIIAKQKNMEQIHLSSCSIN